MLSTQNMSGPGDAIMGVMLAVMCLLVASYPVIRMIGWWMEGGAEPLAAMLAIFMYVVLIATAMVASTAVALLIFGVIAVSALLTPFIGQAADSLGNQRIDNERFDAYSRALEANPMDPVARIAVAEELYKRGEREQATEHMAWTLERFPGLSLRIKPTLESWAREAARRETADWVYCHMCHAENEPGASSCSQCGAEFGTRTGFMQRVRIDGGPKVLIRGWIVTSSVLIITLYALLTIDIVFAAPIILASFIVGAYLFVKWVGGDLGVNEQV